MLARGRDGGVGPGRGAGGVLRYLLQTASNQFHSAAHAGGSAGGVGNFFGNAYGAGWAGEKPFLAADRTAAVLDRLLVDWVANGLGRPVELLDDDRCAVSNLTCAVFNAAGAALAAKSLKCVAAGVLRRRDRVAAPGLQHRRRERALGYEWFCPVCVATRSPPLAAMQPSLDDDDKNALGSDASDGSSSGALVAGGRFVDDKR